MFKRFYPYAYVKDVFVIDYQKLYQMGYRGLIFDIDNTLVHHGEDSTPEVDALFDALHQWGFQTLLLSNNSEERVLRFLKNISADYIAMADKPKPSGYLSALKKLQLPKEQVLVIGDQIFTDIYGANRCQIPSILVQFICKDPNAPIGKRRKFEKLLLKLYQASNTYSNRLGHIIK